MKILMVIDALGKGGKERRMLELIKGLLADEGYSVKLVCLTNSVEYDVVHQLPIEFTLMERKTRKDLGIYSRLYNLIKKFEPDIIHSWGSMSTIYLLPAVMLQKIPFVNGIIADAPANLSIFDKIYFRTRISYPFSDVVIANSRAGMRAYKAPGKKSICIYNGIDLRRFENLPDACETRRRFFPANGNCNLFIVGMVAAFEERKDYATLIKAAITLADRHDQIRFLLVGDGAGMSQVRDSVPASLKEKIVFAGKRSDVEALVNIFDVGVLLTNHKVHGEGISNAIIEYMALGKPVIATAGGGTDEVVADGINGFLIEPANEEQLVQRIEELMAGRERGPEMGKKGRDMVLEKYKLETMTGRYKEVYDSLKRQKNSI